MTRHHPLIRACSVLLLATFVSGCSVKFIYNNLDRLGKWAINDYVDLDRDQSVYVDAQLDSFLYWHRTEELPGYAELLRDIAAGMDGGVTEQEMADVEVRVRAGVDRIQERGLPMVGGLLGSLTDEQVAALPANFEKSNAELLKEAEGKTLDERRAAWADDYAQNFKRFIGRLTPEQTAYLEMRSTIYEPDEQLWVAYRELWQADLMVLLERRRERVYFLDEFGRMARRREDWYGDEYRQLDERNEMFYRQTALALFNMLTERQLTRLKGKLLEYAVQLDELV